MTDLARPTLWGRLTLGQKLPLISVGAILVIAVIVGYTVYAVEKQRSDAAVIDLAGRQRMLTQVYLKEVLLTAQGLKADHAATLRTFDDTLGALVNGGSAVENLETGATIVLPPATLPGVSEALSRQRGLSRQMIAAAEAYLGTSANDPARAARLRELVQANAALLADANGLVKRFAVQAEEKISAVILWEIVLALVTGVIGIGISWQAARAITQPLALCVERAHAIAEGNLGVEPMAVRSRDEIGQLARSFNAMVEALREIASQTRAATENLNSAAAEIVATTQEQAAATRQQAAAVQEITTTVEEINQSGIQVAERARQVAGTAQSISSAGTMGLQAVEAIVKAMEGIRQQAGSVAENIVTLSERTQAIGEIIATVNDIAEQSNLVALNAAIEAADAREDGRRFSVVAGEIKNLADQAKEATRQVRTILEEIQRGINTSVMLTEEAVKRVEYGRDRTAVAEDNMRKMAANIGDSANAFQQIVGATNQQQIGLEQVTQALQEIRQASQQTAASTGQLEHAAANLNSLGQQLRRLGEKYRL